jgi:hypothetical protein
MAKKVNGYILHKRVMKKLEPDGEPKTKDEAINCIAFLEYLLGNQPVGLGEPGYMNQDDWEADINDQIKELRDKFLIL